MWQQQGFVGLVLPSSCGHKEWTLRAGQDAAAEAHFAPHCRDPVPLWGAEALLECPGDPGPRLQCPAVTADAMLQLSDGQATPWWLQWLAFCPQQA